MALRVGLIGCGAIGSELAKGLQDGRAGDACLCAIYDANVGRAVALRTKIGPEVVLMESLQEMLAERLDVIVEAASQDAVHQYAEKILRSGKSLMVMSVGALVEEELLARLLGAAKESGAHLIIPSGAIGAIDALKAVHGEVEGVELITRKPPESLGVRIEKEKILFEGNAREAVKKFPQNINVAATVSLAGIGPDKTRVKIIADPDVKRNVHELRAKGKFGEFFARFENAPSENPKTSRLAALSALATIRRFSENLRLGT